MNNLNKPLKICMLSYRSNPHCGGQGVYLKNLSRALTDLGHNVEVISGPPDPQLDPDIKVHKIKSLDLYDPKDPFRIPTLRELINPINLIEWLGVSTTGFPEPFTFGLRSYLYLSNRLQHYDIIHDNQSLTYGLWALSRRKPTIATIHHPITVDRKIAIKSTRAFWKKLKQLRWHSFINMQIRVSKKLPHIITVSRSAQNDICHDFKIKKNKFHIIGNGIDIKHFHPVNGITRDKNRIIVTNSSDVPLKGLYYLLFAIADISKTCDIKLTVIGQPKKDGGIIKLVKKLDIGHLITFTGRVSNVEFLKHYAKATVAVVPSVYEGFGLPAGEAMACRVPVISTTGGALPEVVGDCGILVPPKDSSALAKAIIKILNNEKLAEKLATDGYKRVHDHFTWKKAAQKTLLAYYETINDYNKFYKT